MAEVVILDQARLSVASLKADVSSLAVEYQMHIAFIHREKLEHKFNPRTLNGPLRNIRGQNVEVVFQ